MIADAIVSRLGKGRVGHLVHANAARGRLVDREGVPGQPPPPIGARDRIAGALDLRQRREQLGAVSLMLGIFVRFWGVIGALQILNLWLGLYNAAGEWPWTYFFLLVDQALWLYVMLS